MAALIRLNSVVQRANGKLFVNATLPDGRVVEGEINVSLDQQSIARAIAQLPADRPMPHLTGQVTLDDDEYRELRVRALLAEEEARRNTLALAAVAATTRIPGEVSVSPDGVLTYNAPADAVLEFSTGEAFAAAVTNAAPAASPKPAARGRK